MHLIQEKIVNFAFTLPPLLPHGGEESLVADISSIILQDYEKCQTPLKDNRPECPQTSNVFPCRVFLYFRCLCIIFVEQTIGTASLSPHTTPTNKKEGTWEESEFFYMEKLVEISFGDLKNIVNRRTVFFVFFKDNLWGDVREDNPPPPQKKKKKRKCFLEFSAKIRKPSKAI